MSEQAWLIELRYEGGTKWVGFQNGNGIWTSDPNLAIRFSRKEDADNFKAYWCATATSTSHMWMDV